MEARHSIPHAATADSPEPFGSSGLAALLETASREAPGAVLMRDDLAASSARQVCSRSAGLAASLRASGLLPGERMLIVTGSETASLVALVAGLRAGLEPVLMPCGPIGPVEVAAHVRASGAVAIVGPTRYAEQDLGDLYASAAALADSIRLIATHGPEPVDGAIDVSARTLDAAAAGESSTDGLSHEPPMIGTFEGPRTGPTLVMHRQAALFADALSLIEQARINPSRRLISTLPPASMAGLIAGPFAALIGASSLVLHGPFEARGFLAACDAEPGFHLVVPSSVGPLFQDPRLAAHLSSLVLVSRFADSAGFVLPPALACDRPVVDLYAFGEDTVLAQRRVEGVAKPPVRIADKSSDGGLGARLNRAQERHPAEDN